MWRRIELHNHSVESDGILSVEELTAYLESQGIRAFSLTDHNTVSGWRALPAACSERGMEFVRGCEITSYYGHLLCQNIPAYVPWDDIDEDNADLLLRRVRELGGLAGPAHPFAVPAPFSNGMHWSMKIHDYRFVDFIEVINNAHPMLPDNKNAILWWADKIFAGFSITPVSGMDLHRPRPMDGVYTTYIEVAEESRRLPLSDQLARAVRACRTCVTKGPVIDWKRKDGQIVVSVFPQSGDGFDEWVGESQKAAPAAGHSYLCKLATQKTAETVPVSFDPDTGIGRCAFPAARLPGKQTPAILFLYEKDAEWTNLVAIAAPVISFTMF